MACVAIFIFLIRWERVRAETECDCRILPASALIFLIFSPGSLSSSLVEFTVNPRNYILCWGQFRLGVIYHKPQVLQQVYYCCDMVFEERLSLCHDEYIVYVDD